MISSGTTQNEIYKVLDNEEGIISREIRFRNISPKPVLYVKIKCSELPDKTLAEKLKAAFDKLTDKDVRVIIQPEIIYQAE